jgi:hypothetical protein
MPSSADHQIRADESWHLGDDCVNGKGPHPSRNAALVVAVANYTEKYSSYSNGCGRCAIGVISAVRL